MKLIDGLIVIGVLLLAACYFPAAHAQEIGRGLICDKAEQVEIYLAHVDGGDIQTALDEVNRNDKTACAIVAVAYLRNEEVKAVQIKLGTARIVAITLIGVMQHGQLIPVPPWPQFTLFLEKHEGA